MLRLLKAYYFDSLRSTANIATVSTQLHSVIMQIADATDKYNKFRAAMGK
jgi:hypothetical protein